MPTTVIAWGPGSFVFPLPQDREMQAAMLADGLVFDVNGDPVRTQPDEGLLDDKHFCIPFSGLVNYIQAIANKVSRVTKEEFRFALLQPDYLQGIDKADSADAISKAVATALQGNTQDAYRKDFWLTNVTHPGKLETLSYDSYSELCKNRKLPGLGQTITACLTAYDPSSGIDLPDAFYDAFLDTNKVGPYTRGKKALRAVIDDKLSHGLGAVLRAIYQRQLNVSLVPMIEAIKQKNGAEKVVLVVEEGAYATKAAGMSDVDVVKVNALENVMRSQSTGAVVLNSAVSVAFLVQTLMKCVSPYQALAAHMSLLRDSSSARALPVETYGAAHLVATHPELTAKYRDMHGQLHVNLARRIQFLAGELTKKSGQDIVSHHAMQRYIELFVYRFIKFFRGRANFGDSLFLVKSMPNEVLSAFSECQEIYGHDEACLHRFFFIWLAAELGYHEAGTNGALTHFIKDLVQVFTAFHEKQELVERVDRTITALNEVLSAEIARIKTPGDQRSDVSEFADKLIAPGDRTPTPEEVAAPPALSTPRKSSTVRRAASVSFADEAEGVPRSRASSTASLNRSLMLGDLSVFGITQEEFRGARAEYFIFPANDNVDIKSYLMARLRIADLPGVNLKLNFRETDAGLIHLQSIYYEQNGVFKYFTVDDGRLVEGGPITNVPILQIKKKITPGVDSVQQHHFIVVWRVDASDLYIGQYANGLHEVSEVNFVKEDVIPGAGAVLAEFRNSLIDLHGKEAELQEIIRQLLTTVDARQLTAKEAVFLSLNMDEVPSDEQGVVLDLQAVYQYFSGSSAVVRGGIDPAGIRTQFTAAAQKILGLFEGVVGLGLLISTLVYIFGKEDNYYPVTDGDIFFYLTKMTAQLIRGAAITVSFSVPVFAVMDLLREGIESFFHYNFIRKTAKLPPNIARAVSASSMSHNMVLAKIQDAMSFLSSGKELTSPEVTEYMDELGRFMDCVKRSQLPERLQLVLVKVGDDLERELQKLDSGDEQGTLFLNAALRAQTLVRKVQAGSTFFGLAAGAAFLAYFKATVKTSVPAPTFPPLVRLDDDAAGGDQALSPVTLASIDALIYAGTYLTYLVGRQLVESGAKVYANRRAQATIWRRSPDKLQSLSAPEDVEAGQRAAAERPATERTALIAAPREGTAVKIELGARRGCTVM